MTMTNTINGSTQITNDGTGSATSLTTNTTVGKINIAEQRAKVEAQYTMLVNAITTDLATLTEFVFRDRTISRDDLLAKLSARISAAEKTKTARLALHAAVADEQRIAKEAAPLRSDMKVFLSNRFGKDNPKLQKYGFTQAKTPQKSAASKAAGVEKARATRAALGTKGKKQRKAALAAMQAAAGSPAPAVSPPAASPAPVQAAAPAGASGNGTQVPVSATNGSNGSNGNATK